MTSDRKHSDGDVMMPVASTGAVCGSRSYSLTCDQTMTTSTTPLRSISDVTSASSSTISSSTSIPHDEAVAATLRMRRSEVTDLLIHFNSFNKCVGLMSCWVLVQDDTNYFQYSYTRTNENDDT